MIFFLMCVTPTRDPFMRDILKTKFERQQQHGRATRVKVYERKKEASVGCGMMMMMMGVDRGAEHGDPFQV